MFKILWDGDVLVSLWNGMPSCTIQSFKSRHDAPGGVGEGGFLTILPHSHEKMGLTCDRDFETHPCKDRRRKRKKGKKSEKKEEEEEKERKKGKEGKKEEMKEKEKKEKRNKGIKKIKKKTRQEGKRK